MHRGAEQSGAERPAKNNTPIRKPGADVAGLSLSIACMRMRPERIVFGSGAYDEAYVS